MPPFTRPSAPMPLQTLYSVVENGHVDTVLVTFTDAQGRLQGKRVHARHFLEKALSGGIEAAGHLLGVDVDMATSGVDADGSWDGGYGDVVLRPDMSTLRAAPWVPSSVMVQCDVTHGGSPVPVDPRQVLRRQIDRAAEMGFGVLAGTELEFLLFDDSYEAAWTRGYRELSPSNQYNADHSILATTRVEPVLRDLRNAMFAAGMTVESAQGASGLGRHLLTFKQTDVLTTADQHVVYKTAVKEIAARHGKSVTFMARFGERETTSSHLQLSLRRLEDDTPIFPARADDEVQHEGRSEVFEAFTAGVLNTLPDFTLFYAPNINSYKRLQPGTGAPTTVAWGQDNRTTALRGLGGGGDLRLENRVPGGDVNPYLAFAAMIAGGLHGVETRRPGEPQLVGDAHRDTLHARVPRSLQQARDLFDDSSLARHLFGDVVVDHYAALADAELRAFEAAVTDWERVRGFERL